MDAVAAARAAAEAVAAAQAAAQVQMVITVCAAAVTIVTTVVGFLMVWVKLKYGAAKAEEAAIKAGVVEEKLDENTVLTAAVKETAAKAQEHAEGRDERMAALVRLVADHGVRISTLEGQMTSFHAELGTVSKDIVSTRHEMRGHLETIARKLDLMSMVTEQKKT